MAVRVRAGIAAILLLSGAAPAGVAETLKPPPGALVAPDWKRRPSEDDLLAVYPTEAFKRGISGKATIACTVTIQGALTACKVMSESPEGMNFGAAAIALTPQFLMRPATLNGVAVPSEARIPINFHGPAGGMRPTGSKKVLPPNLPWAAAPSYSDVAAAYPAKARASGEGGRATLACSMAEDGRLKDCSVATSEPRGMGFDTAAKALAKQFRLEANTPEDRKATHSVAVHLPFTFDPAMLKPGTPTVIGKPNWAAIPTAAQLTAAFASLKLQGTTRVVIACTVEQGGGLRDCSVVSEQPIGAGVGAAALTLTPTFRLTTWTSEGLPAVGGQVQIPIRYEAGTAASPPPAPAPK